MKRKFGAVCFPVINKEDIVRAGDLQKELGLINATPTVCDAMTKKINYKYDIIFAPPKGKSTKLTVRYYLQ